MCPDSNGTVAHAVLDWNSAMEKAPRYLITALLKSLSSLLENRQLYSLKVSWLKDCQGVTKCNFDRKNLRLIIGKEPSSISYVLGVRRTWVPRTQGVSLDEERNGLTKIVQTSLNLATVLKVYHHVSMQFLLNTTTSSSASMAKERSIWLISTDRTRKKAWTVSYSPVTQDSNRFGEVIRGYSGGTLVIKDSGSAWVQKHAYQKLLAGVKSVGKIYEGLFQEILDAI